MTDFGDSEKHPPHKLSESLKRIFSREELRPVSVLASVSEQWTQIVGEELAAHAKPVVIRDRELVISVDHPAWATEVKFHAQHIREAVQERLGPEAISGIKVHVRA